MTENTMPAAEVSNGANEQELVAYELAYHILPTVAEGEVNAVSDELKALITKDGGKVLDEEVAERFELAYEIAKYLEGRYRKFTSAYFGWIRFELTPSALATLTEEVEGHKQVLRSLLVRLTKVEEANPFRFHESLEKTIVRNIDIDEVVVEGEVADVEGLEVDAVVEAEEVTPVV
jgi:ribosomal protein S6